MKALFPDMSIMNVEFDVKTKRWPIILFLILLVGTVFYISQNRYYNFDEFHVLWASAQMTEGKALYSDNLENHFPLAQIIFYLLIKWWGNEATALLAARFIIFAMIPLSLFFIYKITMFLKKDIHAGVLAILLTLLCLVYIKKGIEIRHDAFSTFFIVLGVYWGIRFVGGGSRKDLLLSGLALGLALASTQKAIIWIICIIIGLSILIFQKCGLKRLCLALVLYAVMIAIPLALSLIYLQTCCKDDFYTFLMEQVPGQLGYLSPPIGLKSSSFPYSKTEIYLELLWQNGLFYLFAVLGIISYILSVKKFGHSPQLVIVCWAAGGLLFYLYMRRPFFQSLLPTIPAFSILAALFVVGSRQFFYWKKRVFVDCLVLIAIVGWPVYQIADIVQNENFSMARQMRNVIYCLDHLRPDEKVLCFTHQQIFFEPVFRLKNDHCGENIYRIEPDCFEKKMIEVQCKTVIYDHRTRLLNKEIQLKLKNNYRAIGIGDILIPGFWIKPNSVEKKKVWIRGGYYSNDKDILIDGYNLEANYVFLENKAYVFENRGSEPTLILFDNRRQALRADSFTPNAG